MTINEISRIVLNCAFQIHTRLGPGLYESVYETLLEYELRRAGLNVRRQVAIPVIYDEIKMDDGFRCDLLVEGCLLIEIKSLETLAPVHYKQVLTYLRCADLRLGIMINLGENMLRDGIKRVANNMPE